LGRTRTVWPLEAGTGAAPASIAKVAGMTEVDPIAVAQAQLAADLELVERYGHDQAADHFGGCYWDNQPPVTIVALFTAEVDRHRAVLRSRVTQPLASPSGRPNGPGGRSKQTTRKSLPG
jgi:hypothetical protein